MSYMDELARKWREHDRSFEGRDVLPNGDEVWTYTTLELGLPVLWLKHPDGSFEYRVIHTPGYDQDTGEHWCWECHRCLHIAATSGNAINAVMRLKIKILISSHRRQKKPVIQMIILSLSRNG